MNLIKSGWNFIVTPPQDLIDATYQLGSDVLKCSVTSLVNYGQAVVDIFKQII